MNTVIFKYELRPFESILVDMPKGAKILSASSQGEGIYLWALVDPDAETQSRNFQVYGTGHFITEADDLSFIGTAMLLNGALVWHIFERLE